MKLSRTLPPEGTVRDWLDARAEAGGIAVYFPETGTQLSWRELREAARRFASGLCALGVAKGESVAIVAPNSREGLIAFYCESYSAAAGRRRPASPSRHPLPGLDQGKTTLSDRDRKVSNVTDVLEMLLARTIAADSVVAGGIH